jgi:hypothetical protein
MVDVGLAAAAQLAFVRFSSEQIGAVDVSDFVGLEVFLQLRT